MENRDLFCPICLNLLFRPVLLPCNHKFCKECILEAVEKNKYQCPVCRQRLSNWLRKVKNVDSIVCEDLENEIRQGFPNYYKAKESGYSPMLTKVEQNNITRISEYQSTQDLKICAPGEIHKEYLIEAEKQAYLKAIEDKKNEEASLALIAQLLAEDSSMMYDEFANTTPLKSSAIKRNLGSNCSRSSPPNFEVPPISSPVCHQRKSTDFRSVPRLRRTLLEYAVDKRVVCNQGNANDHSDEEFARKLQEEYTKMAANSVHKPMKNLKRKR